MHKPLLALLLAFPANAQRTPTPAAAAWWATTTALANDGMEGRDTGTEAYERAAKYVAGRFAEAGLQPAGENGTFFQRVPMRETDLDVNRSTVEIVSPTGIAPLQLLQQVTLVPQEHLPPILEGELVFAGYGTQPVAELPDLHGKIAVFFNNVPASTPADRRASLTTERTANLRAAGVALIVSIDNPGAIEPTHWPAAYARSLVLAPPPVNRTDPPLPTMRISAEAAPALFAASGHDFSSLLRDGIAGAPLPILPLKSTLRVKLATTSKDISSPNVLAILPGADPRLAPEYVALSAHLDGYGFGTPVLGDSLYNGTLDDAAYVATLIEMAKDLHAKAPARSLLFCVFTGEEKGLLGSAWFTQHLTVPKSGIVADLNLDQLRPIFPLKILTMEGLDDSTLGATARTVAAQFHVEVRPDREPERNLYRRADNYNFVRIGVPIASFIFGYNPGSPEEVIYRDWYARRYHKPQDDLATPIVWDAAVAFNRFYAALATTIANAPGRPAWLPTSPNAPK